MYDPSHRNPLVLLVVGGLSGDRTNWPLVMVAIR
jgi:hypothetical protein